MKWYIGQEIVCVKSHTQGAVKKNSIYTINGIRQGCCHIQLDVGVTMGTPNRIGYFFPFCKICNAEYSPTTDNTWWLVESLFAPLMDISELENILNKEQIKEKL